MPAGSVILAALAAGAAGATTLPVTRPGIGWVLAGVAATAALVPVALPGGRRPRRPQAEAATPDAQPAPPPPAPPPAPPAATAPAATVPAATVPAQAAAPAAEAQVRAPAPRDPAAPLPVPLPAPAPTPVPLPPASTVATWAGRIRQALWAVATLALLAVGTVRAASWLFTLCVLTAILTATLAVVDARSIRGMILALTMPPIGALRSLPWLNAGVRYTRSTGRGSSMRAIAIGGVTVVLLIVFGALFVSADAAFAEIVERALPTIDGTVVARALVLFPILLALIGGAAFLLIAPPWLGGVEDEPKRAFGRLDWAVPVALLDLLFVAFVSVQLTVMFGGIRYVMGPDGPTFAEYARGGFWQLLAVAGLTLAVIAVAGRYAPRRTRADRVLIRVLLGVLAALTLVIVASAFYRMSVYQEAYGFTRLRVFVSAVEIGLGVVFALVVIAGIRLRGGWLPRAVVAVGVLSLLGLAVLNPDRFIAERNVDRYATTGRIDLNYVNGLSADAVAAFDRLEGLARTCAFQEAKYRLDDHEDGWRDFNVGRYQARKLIDRERLETVCLKYP